MKISSVNNLSFQKKLLAKAGFAKDGKSEECKIYQLEKGIDDDYFNKFYRDDSWKKDGWYCYQIKDAWRFSPIETETYFALEDNNGDCLGISMVEECFDDRNILTYIEVIPKHSKENKNRTAKYIGETFLATIAKYTKNEGKEMLAVPVAISSAYDFYESKCGFRLTKEKELAIKTPQIDRLIRQNQEHTDKKIEFLG